MMQKLRVYVLAGSPSDEWLSSSCSQHIQEVAHKGPEQKGKEAQHHFHQSKLSPTKVEWHCPERKHILNTLASIYPPN